MFYVHVIPHGFLDTLLGLEPIHGAYYIVYTIHAANLYYNTCEIMTGEYAIRIFMRYNNIIIYNIAPSSQRIACTYSE